MKNLAQWLVLGLMMFAAPHVFAQDEAEVALDTANNLAAKGKLSEAVPYYKKVIELAPQTYPLAYFNLAEVQKVRGNCEEAVLMLHLYASIRDTDDARKEAATGLQKCKGTKWPKLAVKSSSEFATKITINGYLAAVNGTFGPAALPPGKYVVEMTAVDHHPKSQEVELADKDVTLETKLEKMTFSGKILVEPTVPGARIRIFEGTTDQSKVLFDLRAPMSAGVEVAEGRHFVEVTAQGHDRWIRNVSVGRDDVATVPVTLVKSRPPELN